MAKREVLRFVRRPKVASPSIDTPVVNDGFELMRLFFMIRDPKVRAAIIRIIAALAAEKNS